MNTELLFRTFVEHTRRQAAEIRPERWCLHCGKPLWQMATIETSGELTLEARYVCSSGHVEVVQRPAEGA
jgi:hypothetical protein